MIWISLSATSARSPDPDPETIILSSMVILPPFVSVPSEAIVLPPAALLESVVLRVMLVPPLNTEAMVDVSKSGELSFSV